MKDRAASARNATASNSAPCTMIGWIALGRMCRCDGPPRRAAELLRGVHVEVVLGRQHLAPHQPGDARRERHAHRDHGVGETGSERGDDADRQHDGREAQDRSRRRASPRCRSTPRGSRRSGRPVCPAPSPPTPQGTNRTSRRVRPYSKRLKKSRPTSSVPSRCRHDRSTEHVGEVLIDRVLRCEHRREDRHHQHQHDPH